MHSALPPLLVPWELHLQHLFLDRQRAPVPCQSPSESATQDNFAQRVEQFVRSPKRLHKELCELEVPWQHLAQYQH